MSYISEYVLANKFATVVQEFKDHKFLADLSDVCGRYEVLSGLGSWAAKHQQLKLLEPIAKIIKKHGDAFILVALWQLAHGGVKTLVKEFPSELKDWKKSCKDINETYKYGRINGREFTYGLVKASCKLASVTCEILETGHYLSFVASNISCFAKYAPGISYYSEIFELGGTVVQLYESVDRSYQYYFYSATVNSMNREGVENDLAACRWRENAAKIVKCTLKIVAIGLGFAGYALMIEVAFASSSLVVSLLITGYKARNAEGQLMKLTAKVDSNKEIKGLEVKEKILHEIGPEAKDLRQYFAAKES